MSNILDFVSTGTAQANRRARYRKFMARLPSARTRREERKLELEYLWPETIEKLPVRVDRYKSEYKISLWFRTKSEFDLFCSAFEVTTYGGNSVHRIGAILKLAKLLRGGVVKYSHTLDKLFIILGGKRYVR